MILCTGRLARGPRKLLWLTNHTKPKGCFSHHSLLCWLPHLHSSLTIVSEVFHTYLGHILQFLAFPESHLCLFFFYYPVNFCLTPGFREVISSSKIHPYAVLMALLHWHLPLPGYFQSLQVILVVVTFSLLPELGRQIYIFLHFELIA